MAAKTLTTEIVKAAIMEWPGLYEQEGTGRRFMGSPVSEIPTRLREAGWKGVGRQWSEKGHLEGIGLTVVSARYVGGARPKRFCEVVVVAEAPSGAHGASQ